MNKKTIISQLLDEGYSEEQIDNIMLIFENEYEDHTGKPFGEIEIKIRGSRERIGTSIIARHLFNEFKKLGYNVNYKFIDKITEKECVNISNNLYAIYYDSEFKLTKENCSPRANIILNLEEYIY